MGNQALFPVPAIVHNDMSDGAHIDGITNNAIDVEAEFTIGHLDKTLVVPMNRQTTSLSAGASELVELKICNKRIIKSWRKGIVFFYE